MGEVLDTEGEPCVVGSALQTGNDGVIMPDGVTILPPADNIIILKFYLFYYF